ncbi:hypothetical protein DOTSEDRAFT_153605 [Dothistroma septosporum NZE10]|uniref:Glucose-methanol-choline oxidoreductase N-terminal domain-containing protein n=1 Tax=Dothistroma septosporum (strain NZE10 / CBS 128990) TaxID=675120 RepID=M2YMP3_DOTSN|nr:hypothetical protein DOTSEDRAFT_153605 [Dothistroma septosporum NZE10]
MKLFSIASPLASLSTAAAQTFAEYTDDNGIVFWQSSIDTGIGSGKLEWDIALPAATQQDYVDEYIGRLVVPTPETGTWLGYTHTSGMTNSLMLVTWIDGKNVMTSFRYASGYVQPEVYNGNATLSVIDSNVNDTHYSLTYRCENCWVWEEGGVSGSQVPKTTSAAAQLIGWAQANEAPTTPDDAGTGFKQHESEGIFAATVGSARNIAYTEWISLATVTAAAPSSSNSSAPFPAGNATATPTGTATGSIASITASATPAACASNSSITSQTWDYIVVGAGAAGIPMADKLSESGATVLLIEKGPPSSGRWGGTVRPEWLAETNLTRFDVPGLDNEIWQDSAGIACDDVGVMAGCVLGGGTAINAGLWWKANPTDLDYNFPEGWKSADMQPAVDRVFERIPFTNCSSTDGIIYQPQGYNVVAGALVASGWSTVTADDVPNQKNFTVSRPNHMFSGGKRGGPMATYLVSANERDNFEFVTGTSVTRVVRDGSRITGVEVEAFLSGGQCGTVNITPKTGRVILSSGTFGTPKILFRSGIGPQDQLEIVSKAEGDKMTSSTDWINLPVGHNLDDHTNTDIVITHPNVTAYDWYGAYDRPITADEDKYLDSRSGILAQSAPNLAAVFWQEIEGADGITRQLQWTARVESSHSIKSNNSMTISQYLGRGSIGRGRATINAGLDVAVSEVPYLQNGNDIAAVKAGIETLRKALAIDPSIQVVYPATNQTLDTFLSDYPLTMSLRSANHWIGTAKMGLDSGLVDNGTAVVDTNTQVYGTDNLFVVDASVFPGMVSTNPSALIVSVAEHASEKILALDNARTANSTSPASSSSFPVASSKGTSIVPTAIAPPGTASPSASGTTVPPWSGEAGQYEQCGGLGFGGAKSCKAGLRCEVENAFPVTSAMGQPISESSTLLNAQIGFLKTHLALIHIPPFAYHLFVQPILSLLLNNEQRDEDGNIIEPRRSWQYWYPFVNVSITPNECSIVCPREQAEDLFAPLVEELSPALQRAITITKEDYSVIMIGGEGLEAGQRVLDLTSPLAMAGIPIFFITSYYSDFILVPFSSRPRVIRALEDRGFVFEATDADGEAGQMTNPASPVAHSHYRNGSAASSFEFPPVATTPPPATVPELQTKTFKTLARNNVHPHVDKSVELVTCAGIKETSPSHAAANFTEGKLQLGITRCLTAMPAPRFFSVTLTDSESASLTLEKRLLHYFPDEGQDVLLGTASPEQIPITLDLKNLPLESTGIVCGVSSRLMDGMKGRIGREMFNMSYLSTSKAGHVIVYEDELEDAIGALRGAQMNGVVSQPDQ